MPLFWKQVARLRSLLGRPILLCPVPRHAVRGLLLLLPLCPAAVVNLSLLWSLQIVCFVAELTLLAVHEMPIAAEAMRESWLPRDAYEKLVASAVSRLAEQASLWVLVKGPAAAFVASAWRLRWEVLKWPTLRNDGHNGNVTRCRRRIRERGARQQSCHALEVPTCWMRYSLRKPQVARCVQKSHEQACESHV